MVTGGKEWLGIITGVWVVTGGNGGLQDYGGLRVEGKGSGIKICRSVELDDPLIQMI